MQTFDSNSESPIYLLGQWEQVYFLLVRVRGMSDVNQINAVVERRNQIQWTHEHYDSKIISNINID